MRILKLFLAVAVVASISARQDVPQQVEQVFAEVAKSDISQAWSFIPKLQSLGRTAQPEIKKGLTHADARVRLVAAIATYQAQERADAVAAMQKLAGEGDSAVRRTTASILSTLARRDSRDIPRDIQQGLIKFFRDEAGKAKAGDDRLLEIALLQAQWRINESIEPRRSLRDIFNASARNPIARNASALALAEMGDMASLEVRRHLRDMAVYPTAEGQMAALQLQISELEDRVADLMQRNPAAGSKYDFSLLIEAMDKLKESYVDPDKIDAKKLIENAAKGMCAGIDPYTAYYDEKAIEQLRKEDLEGEYGGIGARVSMRKDRAGIGWLTIAEPIFSGPAYRIGLRSGDTITQVNGESTANQDLQLLVSKLRGKVGEKVKIKVYSRRWREEREFELARETVTLETTMASLLPGNIGYVKLTTFGEKHTEEVAAAIKDLTDKGAVSFILDLRDNSGGYLDTSVEIANLFLEKGLIVVESRGRGQRDETYRTKEAAMTTKPLVVLVDGGSASASEILAGALRDQGRATLVGERTYGKGSVQKLKMLKTTDDKTAVRMTIAKWYLPSGKSVHSDVAEENGILPDVVVKNEPPDLWIEVEADHLRLGGKIDAYLREKFPANKELFKKLADYDGGDPAAYPDFDALFTSLETRASKDEVRQILREEARRAVADDRGKSLPCDIEVDRQLQRGILEVCKAAKVAVDDIAEYKTLPKSFEAAPNKVHD